MGEPRPPNAPQKSTRTQCYSGCTYCTCCAHLPNLLPTLVGRKPIQARVDTCLKAMNKSRQGEVDRLIRIDTVMEQRGVVTENAILKVDDVLSCTITSGIVAL